jgi:hypothetical protein
MINFVDYVNENRCELEDVRKCDIYFDEENNRFSFSYIKERYRKIY